MLDRLRLRLRALFLRSRVENELDEELRFHLEREIKENVARGMSPEEARYAAIRSFGGVERVKEESRDVRGVRFLEEFWQDLRYGARALLKNPGFTAVAVIALGLGIGANSAIFSVANSLLLRPLPFKDPDKLVQVWETDLKRGNNSMSAAYPNFADWRNQNQVFERIAAYSDRTFNLTGGAEPERIQGAIISPDFFPLLGVKPLLGRVLLPEEDHPNKVSSVVMSERLWRRRFNADPQVIGRTIKLDSESCTVVGVVADIEDLAELQKDTELWISIAHSSGFDNRRGHYLGVLGRLKPGVTREQAQANMDRIAGALAAQYPDSNTDHGVRLVPLQEQIVGDFRLALLVLLGAVLFVLLIASANVANMLLARAAGRRKEIAVRTALGAGRFRLVRQLITESLLLSALGGAVGLLLALWGVYLLVTFGPADLPRAREISVDGRALGFTLAVSLLTGIIFGLAPALQASRPDLNEALKESGRSATGGAGSRRMRSLLVVSEIALSLTLLVGAGLLIRSFLKLQAISPGFNPQNTLTMKISLRGPNYEKDEPVIAFYDQLLDRVRALPGVQSVAIRSSIPLGLKENYADLAFAVEGRTLDPANRPVAFYNAVSPDHFRVMEIPVLRGRPFDGHDNQTARNVIIINETLARRHFPGEDPIGKRMTLNDDNPKEEDWATIVGVVKDTKPRRLIGNPVREMYMPFAQQPRQSMALVIRTTSKPEDVAAAVRREAQTLDRNQPVHSVRTLESVVSETVSAPRFRAFLLGVFAIVALILAMVGVYGVMSYAITQRTHEIGIRMALGAGGADVLKLVIGYGMSLTFAGVGIGLVASFALTRVMSQLLFRVNPTDPLTFVAIPLLLILVAALACCLPARRAMKVDPLIALRCQ
jgi:putative ABC transport system permease protein